MLEVSSSNVREILNNLYTVGGMKHLSGVMGC